MRRIDLAHAVGVTPSGITRLLDGLEASGLVGRHNCTQDHRVTYAVITDAGRAVLRSTAETHLASLVALFAERFTDDELDQLVTLLGRLPGATRPSQLSRGHGRNGIGPRPSPAGLGRRTATSRRSVGRRRTTGIRRRPRWRAAARS